jgi:hypothetical protein
MFLGLLDQDPLVRGMEPDLDTYGILSSKNSMKNLDSYSFCDFFLTFYL